MMCFVHWISAKRRLKESEKTVAMLSSSKYSEKDVPEMVLAQRDFIKKEVEFFGDECVNLAYKVALVFWISILVYVVHSLKG